jgi:hypothetical protein
MKTKSGLAFEFVTTSNQDILSVDSILKKFIQG